MNQQRLAKTTRVLTPNDRQYLVFGFNFPRGHFTGRQFLLFHPSLVLHWFRIGAPSICRFSFFHLWFEPFNYLAIIPMHSLVCRLNNWRKVCQEYVGHSTTELHPISGCLSDERAKNDFKLRYDSLKTK